MKKIRNFFLFFLLSLFWAICFPNQTRSTEEFNSFYKISYSFLENGDALVNHEVSLINQKPDIYVSEYSIKISGQQINNISAWDNLGPLKVSSSKEGETTSINLVFNEKVVGSGQTLSFILKYEAKNLAKKEGRVWKIVLPKLGEENLPDEYSLDIKIPKVFGSLAFASPYPKEIKKENDNIIYKFSKDDILNYGVLLEFGGFQVFDFTLFFHLINDSEETTSQVITLPPDTSYQLIEYQNLIPKPENTLMDADGNWLAEYNLKPKTRLEIKANGKVKIYPSPINANVPVPKDLEKYLELKEFWDLNDNLLKIAGSLKTPRQIYQYVVETLSYNYEMVNSKRERMGAIKALKNPKDALCLEFTDLFVALARAAGIPSREVEGYAYTDNPKLRPLSLLQDILHAWPEFYDFENSRWQSVDPTWGKTTGGFDYFDNFDMSHFAFVIHGLSSKSPLPAGSFKLKGEDGKNLLIEYGQESTPSKPTFEASFETTAFNFLKKEIKGTLIVKNSGRVAAYNFPVHLVSSENLKANFNMKKIDSLLPYGKISLPVTLKSINPIYQNIDETIAIRVGEAEFSQKIEIKIFDKTEILKLLIIIILLVILLIGLKRRRKKDIIKVKNNEKIY